MMGPKSPKPPVDSSEELAYLTQVFLHEWDRRKYVDTKLGSVVALAAGLLSVNAVALFLPQGSQVHVITTVLFIAASVLLAGSIAYVLASYIRTGNIQYMPLETSDSKSLKTELREGVACQSGINDAKATFLFNSYGILVVALVVLASAFISLMTLSGTP